MTVVRQAPAQRYAAALTAFALFVLLALLWAAHAIPIYRKIVTLWGVEVFDYPFVDTETVLSGARCLRAGIDVYVSNPCDAVGRVYDYSPLWMLIAHLPVTMAWGVPIGLLIAVVYFGALTLLPSGQTPRHRLALCLGAISSAAMFAVERGNNDIILFALAALAATLACRSPRLRLIGYGCALLAGWLKYYPLPLMAIAARERKPRLILIALGSAIATAAFVALSWPDLTRALGLIPTGDFISSMFGSIQVAGALKEAFGLPPVTIPLIRWTMAIVALGLGAWIGFEVRTADAIGALPTVQRAFLLVGALLTLACFFTAQNIGYRAIHLLLALPALLALRTTGMRWLRPAAPLALLLLWSECWRKTALYAGKPFGPHVRDIAGVVAWAGRELCWWWLITLLAACIVALLWRSTLMNRRPILWA